MTKPLLILMAASLAALSAAQFVSKVTPEVRRYHDYRQETTVPSFGLAKVKAAIGHLHGPMMSDSAFDRLSTPEKFTYCMIHGEYFSQNCMVAPWYAEEWKKIFVTLPETFPNDSLWSEKQRAFLKSHRAEVIQLIRSTILEKKRVGSNLKSTIDDLNDKELIPDLITTYNQDHKDLDILTVLIRLMARGKYKPMMTDPIYRKIVTPGDGRADFIAATEASRKKTIDLAFAYYRSTAH